MHSHKLSILGFGGAALISLSQAAWDPTRPAVFSDAVMQQADLDLQKELPSHNDHSTPWAAGWIPKYCYNEALTYNLSPSDFEIRNVYYTDCAAPWAICRYKTASKSWDTVIDQLGKIPVGMRQYIANLLILPDNINTCAYTWGGEFQSSSYNPGCFTVGVVAHESSHLLDQSALKSVAGSGAYSSTTHWSGAYDKDTAVPTAYADTDWAEDFAETGRAALSNVVHPGGLAAYSSQVSKIANQLGNYQGRLQGIIFPTGGRCTGKVSSTQALMMSNGQPGKRWAGNPPSTGLEGTGVPEIEKPENVTAVQYVYKAPAGLV